MILTRLIRKQPEKLRSGTVGDFKFAPECGNRCCCKGFGESRSTDFVFQSNPILCVYFADGISTPYTQYYHHHDAHYILTYEQKRDKLVSRNSWTLFMIELGELTVTDITNCKFQRNYVGKGKRKKNDQHEAIA
jgi:hypothetical protein